MSMNRSQTKKFRNLVRQLKRKCPTKLPVRIYRRKLNYYGWTDAIYDGKIPIKIIIVIREDLNFKDSYETLLHEWAHAMTYTKSDCRTLIREFLTYLKKNKHKEYEDHDKLWGLAISKVYQAMEEK